MQILIVDDNRTTQSLLALFLQQAGYTDILTVDSAHAAFEILHLDHPTALDVNIDLILMDITMHEIDGIEATRRIKASERLRDIPIIMVTASDEISLLQAAFDAGAVDYVEKSLNTIELLARVRSALRLKEEMDRRKAREQELLMVTAQLTEANQRLQLLSVLDGLTGIANRRRFDEALALEWRRETRQAHFLSLLLIDIDHFKAYNDTYGHQRGDDCLRQVAHVLQQAVRRPGDVVARYGGEEFGVILPDTDAHGAMLIADAMREQVEALALPHIASTTSRTVTISIGVATTVPIRESSPEELVAASDQALYRAKQMGRNQTCVAAMDDIGVLPIIS